MEVTAELISDKVVTGISGFDNARIRIDIALKELKGNIIPHPRSPCLICDGLKMYTMSDF